MALLLFVILLNQNVVRTMKDSLIVVHIGPEIISYIKLLIEMPLGFIFVILYSKMSNLITTEKAFRYIVIFFISFFSLYSFFLFPNYSLLHPDKSSVDRIITSYPHLKWIILLWSNWTFVLFYSVGELWPIIVSTFLFWHLASKITLISESSRFYSLFKFFGQLNLMVAGSIVTYIANHADIINYFINTKIDNNTATLQLLTLIVIFSGIIIIAIHYFIERKIILNDKYFNVQEMKKPLSLSLKESLKIILSSKYLFHIFIITLSYSMLVNLIEGLWFSKVHQLHSDTTSFILYQSNILFYTGMVTVIVAFLGGHIINILGWFFAAFLTPLVFGIVGSLFFIGVIYLDEVEFILKENFGLITGSLSIVVFIGGLQNILGKGVKYSLFDATKEMLYIPLDKELKTKGKVAVDITGAKLGKSSGSIIQFVIFTIFPYRAYDSLAPFLLACFISISIIWIISVKSLNKEYKSLLNSQNT